MLSTKVKEELSQKIQSLLQEIGDEELPDGEINFILHVDGKEGWSWANIRNSNSRNIPVPNSIVRNLSE